MAQNMNNYKAQPSELEELMIVLAKFTFIIIGFFLLYWFFSDHKPSFIPKELAFLVILAIPTLLIGWIALHVGLFIFKTLFPK